MNICADVPACGVGVAGCELEDERVIGPVGTEKSLHYTTDGLLTLKYEGDLDKATGMLRWRLVVSTVAPVALLVIPGRR